MALFFIMNFLAHIYLSENLDQLCIGNFIADSVKGKNVSQFPQEIQRGILLHREIDTYTDNHPIHKQSRRRLDKKYGHYKGVIIDIFYDHFLAVNWSKYHATPLETFSKDFYDLMQNNTHILPEKVNYMLGYMIPQNWLYNYQFQEGLQRVMDGMNRRTKGKSKMNESLEDLYLHYGEFESDFFDFFENLINFSREKRTKLYHE